MAKFVVKLLIFLLPVSAFYITAAFLANGNTDEYYLKFCSPKQQSLIIGTSKAAQGLQPSVFNAALNDTYNGLHIFNYAFTVMHSPYGPVYLKAIKEKLNTNAKGGLFILAVDSWSIATKAEDPNDSTKFDENETVLNKLHSFNSSPNIEYLLRGYNNSWTDLLLNKIKGKQHTMFLHDDGWLEGSLKMDAALVAKRTANKIAAYRTSYLPYYRPSTFRLQYLKNTIELLQQYGDVYLVRMPVNEEIAKFEKTLMPDFDELMYGLSEKYHLKYFNFIDSARNFVYTDGNHLYKGSGEKLSKQIAQMIKEDKNVTLRNKLVKVD